jgi:hypothetical protein
MSVIKRGRRNADVDTGLVIGQSYVGKARFWIKRRRTADVVVRLGLTQTGHLPDPFGD